MVGAVEPQAVTAGKPCAALNLDHEDAMGRDNDDEVSFAGNASRMVWYVQGVQHYPVCAASVFAQSIEDVALTGRHCISTHKRGNHPCQRS